MKGQANSNTVVVYQHLLFNMKSCKLLPFFMVNTFFLEMRWPIFLRHIGIKVFSQDFAEYAGAVMQTDMCELIQVSRKTPTVGNQSVLHKQIKQTNLLNIIIQYNQNWS